MSNVVDITALIKKRLENEGDIFDILLHSDAVQEELVNSLLKAMTKAHGQHLPPEVICKIADACAQSFKDSIFPPT
jgi:hypothetical protein